MEPAQNKVRYKLALCRCPVKRVEKTPTGFAFLLALPHGINLAVEVPTHADVREGDLLTLYTEVFTSAPPQPTSVQ